MTPEELREEVSIELELIEVVVREILALREDVGEREPTIREKTAAAGFLAQFYNGIENILKRISRFHGVLLPNGDTWHVELFKRFCSPLYSPLPALFDVSLASTLAPYRRFRHVVYHGYGFQLDWSRMREGIENVEEVFLRFKSRLADYLRATDT